MKKREFLVVLTLITLVMVNILIFVSTAHAAICQVDCGGFTLTCQGDNKCQVDDEEHTCSYDRQSMWCTRFCSDPSGPPECEGPIEGK